MAAPTVCSMCDGLTISHCLGSDGSLTHIDDLCTLNKKTGLVSVVIEPSNTSPVPALGICGRVPRTTGIRALVLGMPPVETVTVDEVQEIGLLQRPGEAESLLVCILPGQNSANELAALSQWDGFQLSRSAARELLQTAHERWWADLEEGADEDKSDAVECAKREHVEEMSAMELYLRTMLHEHSERQ
mmetsp:Transcript_45853/g.84096  ORF Transcript_45853/g.84096 Transcript_45853/m.84096 type:complete len:188 (-) Transcript_45853:58-621(-)